MNDELLEKVVRTMIASYNKTTDVHVRPLTYEEVIADGRTGLVQAARVAIDIVEDYRGDKWN